MATRSDTVSAPRVALWSLRLAWLLVALLGGAAIGEALDGRSGAVALVGSIGAWALWAAGAIALAVPSVPALTVVRAIVPAALVAAGVALLAGASSASALGLGIPAVVATTIAGSAELGRGFVQASAYGDEHRFPLRPPLGYLAAAVITWLIMVTAIVGAPLAAAAGLWPASAAGFVLLALGTWFLPRRWHQLSRRWLVLVPAGLVVHDPVVLADPLLLRRTQVAVIRLAAPESAATDLTGPTPGSALEIATTQPITAMLAPTRRHPKGTPGQLTALRIAPTRPGAALTESRRRGLAVG